MKTANKLNIFDQELCRLLCCNYAFLQRYPMGLPRDIAAIEFDGKDHLEKHFPGKLYDAIMSSLSLCSPRFVLDEEELLLFLNCARSLPDDFYYCWNHNTVLMTQWVDTIDEVKLSNSEPVVERWICECQENATYFDDYLLQFLNGAEAIIGWIHEVRDVLEAMGRDDLVPLRLDELPGERTIVSPSPSRPNNYEDWLSDRWMHPDEATTIVMNKLRIVLLSTPNGINVGAEEIYRQAGGNRTRVFFALRCLQYRNEYRGFKTRPKIPIAGRLPLE